MMNTIDEGIDIKCTTHYCEDQLWLKLRYRHIPLPGIHISRNTTYVASRDNVCNLLEEENVYIISTGDFNARTDSLPDFVSMDTDEFVPRKILC